ncbi:hypothetical protein PG911_04180 [Tenacibaculum ovolyticum]|uniref:hypothetical protein n=1 Tax=Tenacibaculum ovolyticum TaxID=104270 RepID=UPI0022F3BC52|nr:hypothetical protein [Tenacibaculum ovolyticum]WBX77471.1 hypothetical protein PG911_04180 [Tenacibaculum ovolyticum]
MEKESFKKEILILKEDSITGNKEELEYLSETKLINNKYPFWGEIKILKSFIKTPSFINRELDECGYILEDSYETWYYLNCEIEVSKTEYVFKKINFTTSNYTLKYGEIVFSKDYSLSDFKNDFPISFIKNKTKEVNKVMITVLSHELADDSYIFTFKNSKLVELYYFFPC